MPFLHGSQGCATYVRRYIISHFREPIDIASSSFSEEAAIFGGSKNLKAGLDNIILQYKPELIGIATTCLSETIGDDVALFIRQFRQDASCQNTPLLVCVSTPSYCQTHIDGFHRAIRSLVEYLAEGGDKQERINVFCGFVSCADIRYLKEIMEDFGIEYSLLPDYSQTLDAPLEPEYKRIPEAGTPIENIARMGSSAASLEFGRTLERTETAGDFLKRHFAVPLYGLGLPIGINETDAFFKVIEKISGSLTPERYKLERGRLIDAYIDAHKYVFEKRAIVYGEEDLVVGIASFLSEIGIRPVLCASGGESGKLRECIKSVVLPELESEIIVREGADFLEIAQEAEKLSADLIVGNSKGYSLSRKLNIPLVRVGFPIHDRIGAQRILHLGYRGAQELFDRIVNALLEKKQDSSNVGYSYM
jgi:nitrogenase molybdenum-iron protein NifN